MSITDFENGFLLSPLYSSPHARTWPCIEVECFHFHTQEQLDELRQKMGSSLSDRYNMQQKGTAKIMSDHERLRQELIKVPVL